MKFAPQEHLFLRALVTHPASRETNLDLQVKRLVNGKDEK